MRFRFEKLDVWHDAQTVNPLLDDLEKLAKRIAALNRSLEVKTSKTPFTRRNGIFLDPRPSTLDSK
jgi:hypothetical protein